MTDEQRIPWTFDSALRTDLTTRLASPSLIPLSFRALYIVRGRVVPSCISLSAAISFFLHFLPVVFKFRHAAVAVIRPSPVISCHIMCATSWTV